MGAAQPWPERRAGECDEEAELVGRHVTDGMRGVIHPGEGVFRGASELTRRQFAAAAAATTAAAIGGAKVARATSAQTDGQASSSSDSSSGETRRSDTNDVITSVLDFEDASTSTTFEPVATFELPLGSQVFMDCDTRAAVLQANETARPITVIGCLDVQSGSYGVVLANPVGEGCAPSECHLTQSLAAWVETNNATDEWTLYAAPFDGSPISVGPSVMKLAQGDADWLPPQVAVSGSTVVWQLMPDPSGPHVQEASRVYRWDLGKSEASELWSSPGRFACAPSINAGVLTITPRVRADEGVYYGIVALDLDHNAGEMDRMEMPASVKPFFATRIGDDFAFSVEANYDSSTGDLGRMGYYVGHGDGPFLALRKEPSAQVAYVGGKYVMRGQLCYFVIDVKAKSYAVLSSASGCADYGDYPATAGTATYFVTYSAVKDESTGIPAKVLVRVFSLS